MGALRSKELPGAAHKELRPGAPEELPVVAE